MSGSMRERIWILAFFITICCAQPFWLACGSAFEQENHENRTAAERPVFSLAGIEEYPAAYEAYYNDRLPFREQLIRINSGMEYYVFDTPSNPNVIKGRKDWLFYNSSADDNPIESYKGLHLFTQEELEEITDNLLRTQAALEERGIEFVLFIAPDKERIYPELLPGYYGEPAKEYRTGQLVKWLRENTDIRVVYPCEELLSAKETYQVYYRLDTHWNYIGAYVGTCALMKELGVFMPPLEEMEITETEPTICDLADMINLRGPLNTDRDFLLSGYDTYHLITDTHELTGEYRYHCSGEGADPRRLFMVRDSFADAMDDFTASRFAESDMVHYSSYSQKRFEEETPDIFVYETVERRIGELKGFKIE